MFNRLNMKNNYMPTAHAAIKHNHAKANIGKKKERYQQ